MKIVKAVALVLPLLIYSSAQAEIVNLNSRDTNNPITLNLEAGLYEVTTFAGDYTAWNPWGYVSGCTTDSDCNTGWRNTYKISSSQFDDISAGSAPKYRTAEIALANAPLQIFVLTQSADVTFGIYDSYYSDNTGGLSLDIQRVAAVPEPSTYALMLGGIGLVGFMAARRRKQF